MIGVSVLGYGNIGSGVAQILRENADCIKKSAGEDVTVLHVCDLREFPGDPCEDILTHDASEAIHDPAVQIVVETMGGVHPACEFVKDALTSGRHVATSNKELVAACGTELIALAREKHVNFFFEASVGGGIPIIRPLTSSIVSDHVRRIEGILNGTTNYMLFRMQESGLSFEAALKEAQDLGFAERDPAADIEGADACRKIAILCSLAFGQPLAYTRVPTEGITGVTPEDFVYAEKMGCTVKLLATGRQTEDGVSVRVAPVLLPLSHPLAGIRGVTNAVLVEGDMCGTLTFTGAGAGKLPTASAVCADIVEAVRHPQTTVIRGWEGEELPLADAGKETHSFFVRLADSVEMSAFAEYAEQVFAGVIEGEAACVTAPLTEEAFAALCKEAPVISYLRVA